MKLVPAAVTNKLGRSALELQKLSPNVLFGVGIAGVVGGTVLACRATLKTANLLSETSTRMDEIKSYNALNYNDNDRAHDLSLVRVQTSIKIVRYYTPAVIVSGIGIAALTSSHHILTKRNAALTAAYTTLDEAFRRYRGRVIDKFGEEQDQQFMYETEKVTITDGKGKKKDVVRVAPGELSGYARFFDQYCQDWGKDPEVNLYFLKCQQNYCNDLLKARGHVFLNEVYDRLGMPRSQAGAVVGWILSDDGSTDNYISFGVFEGQSDQARDFVNGRNDAVLCDFNVDGIIFDKIERRSREELSWQRAN